MRKEKIEEHDTQIIPCLKNENASDKCLILLAGALILVSVTGAFNARLLCERLPGKILMKPAIGLKGKIFLAAHLFPVGLFLVFEAAEVQDPVKDHAVQLVGVGGPEL